MILNDKQIAVLCYASRHTRMIDPYEAGQVRSLKVSDRVGDVRPVISYGQSAFGYDIRLGRKFLVFTNTDCSVVDPKKMRDDSFVERMANPVYGTSFSIPPHSFVLGESMETFDMPDNVMGLCLGKSTYARCGIITPMTPIEPGWRGRLTLEIANSTSQPALVYPGEGIVQVVFFRGETPTRIYSNDGKYQDQDGVTPAKV